MSTPLDPRPQVVAKMGSDGRWQVLVVVPLEPPVWERVHEILLDADQAERLAANLIEYAALVRDKAGLPGGKVMP